MAKKERGIMLPPVDASPGGHRPGYLRAVDAWYRAIASSRACSGRTAIDKGAEGISHSSMA